MSERISRLPDIDLNLPLRDNISLAKEKYQIVKKFDEELHKDGKSVENSEITEEVACAVGTLREMLSQKQVAGGLPRKTVTYSRRFIEKYGSKADAVLTEIQAKS